MHKFHVGETVVIRGSSETITTITKITKGGNYRVKRFPKVLYDKEGFQKGKKTLWDKHPQIVKFTEKIQKEMELKKKISYLYNFKEWKKLKEEDIDFIYEKIKTYKEGKKNE